MREPTRRSGKRSTTPAPEPARTDQRTTNPVATGPVIVGVDGSERSIDALALANLLGPALRRPVPIAHVHPFEQLSSLFAPGSHQTALDAQPVARDRRFHAPAQAANRGCHARSSVVRPNLPRSFQGDVRRAILGA